MENVKKLKFELSHKLLSNRAKSFINGFLQESPTNRFEHAKAIKEHPFFQGVDWELIRCKKGQPILKLEEKSPLDLIQTNFESQRKAEFELDKKARRKMISSVPPQSNQQQIQKIKTFHEV